MFVSFDPRKHKGYKLYEIQTEKYGSKGVAFKVVSTDVSYEVASKTPWYYFIRLAES